MLNFKKSAVVRLLLRKPPKHRLLFLALAAVNGLVWAQDFQALSACMFGFSMGLWYYDGCTEWLLKAMKTQRRMIEFSFRLMDKMLQRIQQLESRDSSADWWKNQ
jgi:hypothetical protein